MGRRTAFDKRSRQQRFLDKKATDGTEILFEVASHGIPLAPTKTAQLILTLAVLSTLACRSEAMQSKPMDEDDPIHILNSDTGFLNVYTKTYAQEEAPGEPFSVCVQPNGDKHAQIYEVQQFPSPNQNNLAVNLGAIADAIGCERTPQNNICPGGAPVAMDLAQTKKCLSKAAGFSNKNTGKPLVQLSGVTDADCLTGMTELNPKKPNSALISGFGFGEYVSPGYAQRQEGDKTIYCVRPIAPGVSVYSVPQLSDHGHASNIGDVMEMLGCKSEEDGRIPVSKGRVTSPIALDKCLREGAAGYRLTNGRHVGKLVVTHIGFFAGSDCKEALERLNGPQQTEPEPVLVELRR